MKFQILINIESLEELHEVSQALTHTVAPDVRGAGKRRGAAPDGVVVDLASGKARKAKGNSKAAAATEAEVEAEDESESESENETPAKAEKEIDFAEVRDQALKICRGLLESGSPAAKQALKKLRDDMDVAKLSDVPLERAALFLSRAQALQDAHGE